MAQRQLLKRSLAFVMARKLPIRCWPPPSAGVMQTTPRNFGSLAGKLTRLWYTTRIRKVIFDIRDGPDFQERVLNSNIPVVVDFRAQWCGPCKILGPRLEKTISKQRSKVMLAKVDIDESTDLAIDFEVTAVTTVLAIKNGDVVDQFVGLKNEDQLETFLDKLVSR